MAANPHYIESGFFYCPYVPLQYNSVVGLGTIDLGLFIAGKHYNNVHSYMGWTVRRELKIIGHFVRDMLP